MTASVHLCWNLTIVGIGQEADRRGKDATAYRDELSKAKTRRQEDLIRQHWFQLLLLLPAAIPEQNAIQFRKNCTKYNGTSLLKESAVNQELAQWSDAPKDNEEFLKYAARLFVGFEVDVTGRTMVPYFSVVSAAVCNSANLAAVGEARYIPASSTSRSVTRCSRSLRFPCLRCQCISLRNSSTTT